jgi:phosphate starvation-inducible PhoH-like protein
LRTSIKITKKQKRDLKKIILVKSVTILEGEDVGFLKGDFKGKDVPIYNIILDNFYKIIGEDNTAAMLNEGLIEVLPLHILDRR